MKTKIQLKNTGNETLLITRVKPACGCTTAPLDKNELQPGEVATLDITLRVSSSSKNLTKTIRVESNDPAKSKEIIYLKANVVTPLDLSPRNYFRFRNLKVGYETAATLTLENRTNDPVKITDVVLPDDEDLKLNVKKNTVLKPGEKLELIAKIKPKKSGSLNCKIVLKTTNKEYEEFTIRCSGKVEQSAVFNNN